MKPITPRKIDLLQLMSLEISNADGIPQLRAEFGLYNSAAAVKVGAFARGGHGWSPKTLSLLQDLINSMEQDAVADLSDGPRPAQNVMAESASTTPMEEPPSLSNWSKVPGQIG